MRNLGVRRPGPLTDEFRAAWTGGHFRGRYVALYRSRQLDSRQLGRLVEERSILGVPCEILQTDYSGGVVRFTFDGHLYEASSHPSEQAFSLGDMRSAERFARVVIRQLQRA